jgi:NifU-like protein involved in Fe-S cluster formation
MEYSTAVARHFRQPAHAGILAGRDGRLLCGEAGTMAEGTWVVFHARVDGERVTALSFQAYACPHVIAACSRTTELLTGAAVAQAADFDPATLMAELEIPVEKRGRLLILEDALRNCFRDWDTTRPASARAV